MKYIKWDYNISGYLSEEEKGNCKEIDKCLEVLHSQNKKYFSCHYYRGWKSVSYKK